MLTLDVIEVQERFEEIIGLLESGAQTETTLTRDGKPVAMLQHLVDASERYKPSK